MFNQFIIDITAFISTNLDDLFVLTFLFSIAKTSKDRITIATAQYCGLVILTLVGTIIGKLINGVSPHLIGLIGVIPIIMAIHLLLKRFRKSSDMGEDVPQQSVISFIFVISITISNGADNISVYVPLFSQFNILRYSFMLIIFAIMTFIWVLIGYNLARLPIIRNTLAKTNQIAIPIILFLIGCYIISKNGLPFF